MNFKTEKERHNPLIEMGDYISTKEMFLRLQEFIPNKNLLAELNENQEIIYHSASEIEETIENIGDGLIDCGLEGKHIAICAENSYHYLLCDMAICGGAGVSITIDKDANVEILQALLTRCDADAIIFSSGNLEKVLQVKAQMPRISTLICIDKKIDNILSLNEVIEKGKRVAKNKYYLNKTLDLNTLCKIIFTSGTTGANKGVMLSQNNLATNINNSVDIIKWYEGESEHTAMSVLPMHHATEINTHLLTRLASGKLTYINNSMKTLMQNIKIFKPTSLTIVPMIVNAFYKTIWLNAKKQGFEEELQNAISTNNFITSKDNGNNELFKKAFAPFGGNLRMIICGGAILPPELVRGMRNLGVYIINGYGISECSPLVAVNTDTLNDPYSIGTPCSHLKIKLVDKDETTGIGLLCVKGGNVSLGYYKDEKATKEVFSNDGWFNTGDLAKIENGKVFLMGRKKNIIILDNGKNVCPEEIEHEVLINIPYCKECVAYAGNFGNNRRGICLGLLLNKKIDKEQIKNDFRNYNKNQPLYKQINYINIVEEEYKKTATQKIMRGENVMKKHDEKNGIIL